MILHILRVLALALLCAMPVAAQESTAPDYAAWERVASDVQDAVSGAEISDQRLSEMRADIVRWRNQFIGAQSAGSDQIGTVKAQIEALGPAPAEGESEDATIAARRSELNSTLAKLQAPSLAATEAASRADGIIRNIDRLIRERQADKLLRLSPSAANPSTGPRRCRCSAGWGRGSTTRRCGDLPGRSTGTRCATTRR